MAQTGTGVGTGQIGYRVLAIYADRGRRDPDDDVVRFLDCRVRHIGDLDVLVPLPCQRAHLLALRNC